jgi:hypothetical protein
MAFETGWVLVGTRGALSPVGSLATLGISEAALG